VGSAMALGDGSMLMVRVKAAHSFDGALRNMGLLAGNYSLTTLDMVSGASAVSDAQITDSRSFPVKFASVDQVLVFRQK